MNDHVFTCSSCGAVMSRVKVLPKRLAGLARYQCACGHCEDLKNNHKPDRMVIGQPFHLRPAHG